MSFVFQISREEIREYIRKDYPGPEEQGSRVAGIRFAYDRVLVLLDYQYPHCSSCGTTRIGYHFSHCTIDQGADDE
jgi:hypothetical protein